MVLSKNVRIEKDDNYVILINVYNGLWHRMTHEVFKVISIFISSKLPKETFINDCVDPSDKDYIKKTIDYLCKLAILEESNIIRYPDSIGFAITHRCNLNCKHCSYNAGSIDEEEKVSNAEIIEILKKIIDYHPTSLSITGGEPLVRSNISEVMEILKNSKIKTCNLMTNGLILNKTDIKKIISTFNSFDISIDGVDDRTCALVRGHGVYKQVTDNVELLISNGVDPSRISLSMVLSSENEKLVSQFYEINDRLGTIPVVRSFAYLGRGALNENLYKLDSKELKVICPELNEMTAMNCGAAQSELYIDCDGGIYPCPMIIEKDYLMGNMLNIQSLKDFFKNEEHTNSLGYIKFIKKFMPENYKPCSECKHKYFCIHCPVQHKQYLNKEYRHMYCKNKKLMCNKVWEK